MPVRKIKKNYRSVTGMFYSEKNKRHVAYESLLERDFFLLLEFDSSVQEYEEQPVELSYLYGNRKIKYTPDCLVYYNDQLKPPCIFEIKYSDEIKNKRVFLKQKFDQIEQYLSSNDMRFKLFTELDIRTQLLENIKFLYRFSGITSDKEIMNTIEKTMMQYKGISLSTLLAGLAKTQYEQARYTPYIWNMIYHKQIQMDMYQPLSSSIKLRLSNGKN